MIDIDEADVRILDALQADGSLSVNALAEIVHLSSNACWRRMKRLEECGAISKRVALVNPDLLGVPMTIFVNMRAKEHSQEWLLSLVDVVKSIKNVVEFYRIAGDVDYILKIRVKDIAEYDTVYKAIISRVQIADISSSFSMEEIIYTTAVPLRPTK